MKLIDADVEIKKLEEMKVEGEVFVTAVNFAKIILREAPTIDAVEVVRCGECKHMMPDGRCVEFADSEARPSASDYCSYAEKRKTDGLVDEVARDIATIIENEKDMRVIRENAEQKWIPCNKGLPMYDEKVQDFEWVLCTTTSGDVTICWFGKVPYSMSKLKDPDKPHFFQGTRIMDEEVVAWMLLPKPYKGEKDV